MGGFGLQNVWSLLLVRFAAAGQEEDTNRDAHGHDHHVVLFVDVGADGKKGQGRQRQTCDDSPHLCRLLLSIPTPKKRQEKRHNFFLDLPFILFSFTAIQHDQQQDRPLSVS